MVQLENIKKNHYILFSLFVFFCIIVTTEYTTSHSKYMDTNQSALLYDTQLYQLYKGSFILNDDLTIDGDKTDYKKLWLNLRLSPNDVKKETESETYFLSMPTGCSVSSLSNSQVSGNTRTYSLNLTSTTNYAISCNVKDIVSNQLVSLAIEVHEQVEQEEKFLYRNGGYEISEEKYYMSYPKPVGYFKNDTYIMSVDATNKLTDFLNAMRTYINTKNSAYTNQVLAYLESTFKTDTDLMNKTILGLTISKVGDEYHYKVEENLIGYARTAQATKNNQFYFSSNNKNDQKVAFTNYVKKYVNQNSADSQLILDYVNGLHEDGISYILTPNDSGVYPNVLGFNTTRYKDTGLLVLEDYLLDAAYAKKNKSVRITTGKDWSLMLDSFYSVVPIAYPNLLSNEMWEKMINFDDEYMDIIASVINNSVILPDEAEGMPEIVQGSFHDYFMKYDTMKSQYVMIEVFSTDSKFNFVDMESISVPTSMKLSFLDLKGTLQIDISGYTKAQIQSIYGTSYGSQLSITDNGSDVIVQISGLSRSEILEFIQKTKTGLAKLDTPEEPEQPSVTPPSDSDESDSLDQTDDANSEVTSDSELSLKDPTKVENKLIIDSVSQDVLKLPEEDKKVIDANTTIVDNSEDVIKAEEDTLENQKLEDSSSSKLTEESMEKNQDEILEEEIQ